MNAKRLSIVLVAVLVMAFVGGGIASAQEPEDVPVVGQGRGPHGERFVMSIVSEALGLTPQEIFEQMQDGATLAEVIEANGGDVEDITAQIVAAISEEIDADLATIEEHITELLNSSLPEGLPNFGRGGRDGRPGSGLGNRPGFGQGNAPGFGNGNNAPDQDDVPDTDTSDT